MHNADPSVDQPNRHLFGRPEITRIPDPQTFSTCKRRFPTCKRSLHRSSTCRRECLRVRDPHYFRSSKKMSLFLFVSFERDRSRIIDSVIRMSEKARMVNSMVFTHTFLSYCILI